MQLSVGSISHSRGEGTAAEVTEARTENSQGTAIANNTHKDHQEETGTEALYPNKIPITTDAT